MAWTRAGRGGDWPQPGLSLHLALGLRFPALASLCRALKSLFSFGKGNDEE